ncbi:hypothetical protein [Lacipirellula sp.]|uniref:hypothetical protein n=1 Tax=Lacipirellula sp. TaxID=2691419 RepID=UPI003D1105B9
MLKRILLAVAVVAGTTLAVAPQADAGIFVRRVAPVRRVAYPPYPVARAAVARPVVGPVLYPAYRPVVYGGGGFYGGGYYGGRGFYGPGISIGIGGFGY